MEERRQKFYPADEIVALVRSLDRPQDEGLFSKDVLLVYPHLAEEYTRVCPRRCDLATAAEKAASDVYSYDVKLTALRDDVELMVNNCHRFNGTEGALADIANRFEAFAKEQIDAYVAKKTGGRRVSSFRLSTATAAGETTRGKRQREESKNTSGDSSPQQSQQSRGSKRSHPTPAGGGSSPVTSAEVVKLVESLNRREDKGAFAVDVATAYPELKQSYEEVCPVKMNLALARERAASGYYLGMPQCAANPEQPPSPQFKRRQLSAAEASTSSVFGSTVAQSMTLLRNDVELMVSNCLRFNANAQAWVKLAKSFHSFAHKKIDEFVLRHAPALKGTKSGVDAYVNEADQQSLQRPQQLLSPLSQSQQLCYSSSQDDERKTEGTRPTAAAAVVASTAMHAKKEAVAAVVSPPPRASAVTVVKYTTPMVVPTALQPVFATPDALRRRLVSDHLHRGTLRARLIRSSALAGEGGDTGGNKDDNGNNNAEEEEGAGEFDRKKETQHTSAQQTFGPALSCRAVLRAFAASVEDFYQSQRERQDFVTPFEYPRQEEQLYTDCIALIEQQFEHLFLHTLVYDQEKADCYEWSAAKAVWRLVKDNAAAPLASAAPDAPSPGGVSCWLDDVHLCYLVRFLQHFPQLMGLACATPTHSAVATAAATTTTSAKPTLHITEVAKGVIEKLARITEELLAFIAQYEQKVGSVENPEKGGQAS
ncbi:hypothetical protein TraAM80_01283 [Trypanosoma rangeli]|uniref:Bromo domain-containing protein n=1 Tax=Trypanosoma rangeli TaxID=5698 RepID=A0A3R7RQU7_TRYRA|nr:uncharacterized protein TraAM80_01283 [Trypanosoma rangeli]RNF10899.1 hypothetical protein TraAM80_01283 [Trypanosoma rangeli]|eukprot:RNF10899.1 hypothetical protein TraAM80_01283 [Trypanosoma rangeli]